PTWPASTFRSLGAATAAGTKIEAAVLGAYLDAATTITVEPYPAVVARTRDPRRFLPGAFRPRARGPRPAPGRALVGVDGQASDGRVPACTRPRAGDEPAGALPWVDGSVSSFCSPCCWRRRPARSRGRPVSRSSRRRRFPRRSNRSTHSTPPAYPAHTIC